MFLVRTVSKLSHLILPLFLFFSTLLVYLHNLSPSVYGGDVGDLVSAASVFGVAHPPGYPLFTFLGILINFLPINATPAFKVGILSAVFSAFSVYFVYFTILRLTKNTMLSVFTSFYIAFFYIFWLYAEVAEVFALNTFFATTLLYFAISYYKTKKEKYFYFLSFAFGLALTNHHTIVLIIPSLLLLIYKANKSIFVNWRIIVKGFLLVLLGFSVYLYVPLAALKQPPINWDNAININNFLRLLLRQDYGTFSSAFSNLSLVVPTFHRYLEVKNFFQQLFINVTPVGVFLATLGSFKLYRKDKFVFFSLLIAFLLSGPIFTGYAGFPLIQYFHIGIAERFFIMPFIFFIFFIPFGVIFFVETLNTILKRLMPKFEMKKIYKYAFYALFFLLPIFLFKYNFPKTDLSKVWIGDNLAKDILYPLPKDSLLLIRGDTPYFNTEYIKYALKKRTDIEIINSSGIEISNVFIKEKTELAQKRKNKVSKEKELVEVLKIVAQKRSVFSLSKLENNDYWVPFGLVFKFIPEKKNMPSEKDFLSEEVRIWSTLHIPYPNLISKPSYHNLTIASIPSYYSSALANIGDYIVSSYEDMDTATKYFNQAVTVNPKDKYGYSGLGYVYLSQHKCDQAEKMFNKVLEVDMSDKPAAVLLYATYANCFKNMTKAQQVAAKFENTFSISVPKQIEKFLDKKQK